MSVVDVGGTSVAFPTIYATSTVVVGGTSVACPTIYTTYTVVGWWCERCMHARQFTLHTRWLVGGTSVACPTIYNLHYIHGVWLVVRPTIYLQTLKPLSFG